MVTLDSTLTHEAGSFSSKDVVKLRKDSGLTVVGFANVMGVSVQTIWRWEQNRVTTSPMANRLLAQVREKVDVSLRKAEARELKRAKDRAGARARRAKKKAAKRG